MVARGAAVALILSAGTALAQSPWQMMFPRPDSCYQRDYSASHLAGHPQQRVTKIVLAAAPTVPQDPWPAVRLQVTLRGADGGMAEAMAYCENIEATLFCGMEGDAGTFAIEAAANGAILVKTGRDGMSLETESGFVTLEQKRGDDRSFLLYPATGCE